MQVPIECVSVYACVYYSVYGGETTNTLSYPMAQFAGRITAWSEVSGVTEQEEDYDLVFLKNGACFDAIGLKRSQRGQSDILGR